MTNAVNVSARFLMVCVFDETTIRPDEPYNQADVHNFLVKLSPLSTPRFRACLQVFDGGFARDYPNA